MYERFIKQEDARAIAQRAGFLYSDLQQTGKLVLKSGVYLTLRKHRHYLLDTTSTTGLGLYEFAPDAIKPTLPCRIDAADAGTNLDHQLSTEAAKETDRERQDRFRSLLMAV